MKKFFQTVKGKVIEMTNSERIDLYKSKDTRTRNECLIANFMNWSIKPKVYPFVNLYDENYNDKSFPICDNNWDAIKDIINKIDNILYKFSCDYIEGNNQNLDGFYNLELENIKYSDNEIKFYDDAKKVCEDIITFINWYNNL